MTDDELKNIFYDFWSTEITDCQLINAKQDAPRPEKPYATIDFVMMMRENSRDELRGLDDEGIMSMTGFRKAILHLNIFGNEAQSVAETLIQNLSKESILDEYFRGNQVAIVNVSDIRDLSELLETKFERRLFLEVSVRYREDYTDDVGIIETVVVNDDEYTLG